MSPYSWRYANLLSTCVGGALTGFELRAEHWAMAALLGVVSLLNLVVVAAWLHDVPRPNQ